MKHNNEHRHPCNLLNHKFLLPNMLSDLSYDSVENSNSHSKKALDQNENNFESNIDATECITTIINESLNTSLALINSRENSILKDYKENTCVMKLTEHKEAPSKSIKYLSNSHEKFSANKSKELVNTNRKTTKQFKPLTSTLYSNQLRSRTSALSQIKSTGGATRKNLDSKNIETKKFNKLTLERVNKELEHAFLLHNGTVDKLNKIQTLSIIGMIIRMHIKRYWYA